MRNGTTIAASTPQKIRPRLSGAIRAPRKDMMAKAMGMTISNHHSGTPPASVSTRARSKRSMSSDA